MRISFLIIIALFAVVLSSTIANAATVVNIDINGARNDDGGVYVPQTFVGVGAFGTSGTVFNGILADVRPTDFDAITVTGTNLLDQFGVATSVGFTASLVGGDTAGGGNDLVNDYIFNNGSPTSNVGLPGSPFTISGLTGTVADLFFYQPSVAPGNNYVTINGSQGTTTVVGGFTGRLFTGVPIVGGTIVGDFADLSNGSAETAIIPGLSISMVPEPASLVMFALGAVGLLAVARRRHQA